METYSASTGVFLIKTLSMWAASYCTSYYQATYYTGWGLILVTPLASLFLLAFAILHILIFSNDFVPTPETILPPYIASG